MDVNTELDAPFHSRRPPAQGTVLGRLLLERRIYVHQVGTILHVSDRTIHNYLTRRRRVPVQHLGALCDFLDMDPEELVDESNYLLEL